MKKRIFVDMDGTVAEWRAKADFSDLFRKDYFRSLKPTEVADFINYLVKNDKSFDIYILSVYIPESYGLQEKKEWLDEYMPDIDVGHRLFVPDGCNKADFVMEAIRKPLDDNDVLIDDYTKNLTAWSEAGGKAIKWLNGINGINGNFHGIRVGTLKELYKELKK